MVHQRKPEWGSIDNLNYVSNKETASHGNVDQLSLQFCISLKYIQVLQIWRADCTMLYIQIIGGLYHTHFSNGLL